MGETNKTSPHSAGARVRAFLGDKKRLLDSVSWRGSSALLLEDLVAMMATELDREDANEQAKTADGSPLLDGGNIPPHVLCLVFGVEPQEEELGS